MATPIKVLVSDFQARKIAIGNQTIILQVRRKAGEPVVKYRAKLCEVEEIVPPRLGKLQGRGMLSPAEALYRRFVQEIADYVGHDGITERAELNRAAKHYLGDLYQGAFSVTEAREITLTRDKPYMILNTGEVGRGEHWQAAVYQPNGDILYDSLGGGDTDPDAEQSVSEDNCGQRSLAFLRVVDALGLDAAMDI